MSILPFILQGELNVGGKRHTLPCEYVLLAEQALGELPKLLTHFFPAQKTLLIADENTFRACGKAIADMHALDSLVLPAGSATREAVDRVKAKLQHFDAALAVGSGTVNDSVKLAAYELGKPYGLVATALSMNGYLSATSSIMQNGSKQSINARMPVFAVLDIDILAASPVRLTRAGFGDSICRGTVQADYLLSHLLLGTEYDTFAFDLVRLLENALLQNAKQLGQHNTQALGLLGAHLLLSGIGMALTGSSASASQGEHLLAHYMHSISESDNLHGEEIGITTQTIANIQHAWLEHYPHFKRTYPTQISAGIPFLNDAIKREYEAKKKSLPVPAELNRMLTEKRHDITHRLREVMVRGDVVRKALEDAGAKTNLIELEWREKDYAQAIKLSACTRNRFTFLDWAMLSVRN